MESNVGVTRTDMYCHNCRKDFLAFIDFGLNGNHVIECPHCGHEHCRVVKNGEATSDRWDSRNQEVDRPRTRKGEWVGDQMKTQTASHFLRDRWLNRAG